MGDFVISIDELKRVIGTARAPLIFDVRRRAAYDEDARTLPGARWREHARAREWAAEIPPGQATVVYCVHGHNVSQLAAAALRDLGVDARQLEDGIEGWRKAGGPTVLKSALPKRDDSRPTRWVTRVRPKVDRIACPWLIRRFVDPAAEFYFVTAEFVKDVADELGAVPFDIEGVDFGHEGDRCTFDIMLDRFGLDDPALRHLAVIVRGADTARPELAAEAAGLLAVSLGNSALSKADDRGALVRGFPVYDALYAWRRFAAAETHNWPAQKR